MKKIYKSFLFYLIILSIVFSLASNVFASENNNSSGVTTLEIAEDNICNIELDDLAKFEKKITEFDQSKKTATLTLSLTNLKELEESKKDVEIFFVIDNSASMTADYIDSITRKQAVINSANTLVDKLFAENDKVNVGVVGFSSLDSAKGETEGTINDATLRQSLSNSVTDVKNAISNLSDLEVGPRTNIEAGITIAYDNFSSKENVQRYIILLTDGVPNNTTDGTFLEYSDHVLSRTKSKLEEIESNNINIISAMINLDEEIVEPTTGKTYKQLAEAVFGTEENPTVSKYFSITDDEIENTIVNDIFNNLVITFDNSLKNITIVDYFPQEIIDNFNFEYVATPNIGEVSQTIDTSNNSITWNIELLNEGETATLSYNLTLKDDYNEKIIDVILPTNEKVDISAEKEDNTTIDESSDVSPKLIVKYEEPPKEPVDNTISNKPIPQTGEQYLNTLIILVSIILLIAIIRNFYLKKHTK